MHLNLGSRDELASKESGMAGQSPGGNAHSGDFTGGSATSFWSVHFLIEYRITVFQIDLRIPEVPVGQPGFGVIGP